MATATTPETFTTPDGAAPALDVRAIDHLLDILETDGSLHPGIAGVVAAEAVAAGASPVLVGVITGERDPEPAKVRATARALGLLRDLAALPAPRTATAAVPTAC